MRQIIILFLFLIASRFSSACSAAYQYSLFPLGSSMGQLLVLEVEFNRYLSTPDNQMMQIGGRFDNKNNDIEVRWKGSIKLYRIEADSMILVEDLGFTDLLDSEYKEALLPFFKKAFETAIKMPMFEEAVLEKAGICHHDRSCNFIKLTIDEKNSKFYASSNEKGFKNKKCVVNFSKQTLQKVENSTKIKFTDFDNIDKEYQIDFFRLWSPQTVRRYSIGGQTVQVFTIGRGDKSRYTLKKEEKWREPMLETVAHYTQGNDVLFHGQRFDFLQIF